MDRLSALDAEFLHLEDGIAHLHIAGACIFEGPAPDFAELTGLIASKLHLIGRYRQRVRNVPLGLGRPVWVDDPHFDLEYHVRHTALPAPGDDAAFARLMGRLMSSPLDRERPLWEAWLVEGLEGDRWAVVFKVHHCMIDGIAGVELLTVLLDLEPQPEPVEPVPWKPEPEPAGVHKVLDAWSGLAGDAVKIVSRLPGAITAPGSAAKGVGHTVTGLTRYVVGIADSDPHSLSGPIGPHRCWAWSEVPLADVKAVGKATGATVNDVVLAALAGGYRALLESRGEDADSTVVTAMVPVSTRREDGRGVPDNEVSMLLYELPVHLGDPVERLAAVREQMSELKQSHMVEAGEAVTQLGDLAPPMLLGPVSRLVARALQRLPRRSINTVTTNVPGPQFPLYCLGREMIGYRPFVPIYHGLRIGTAILSYNGRLAFGITGDRESAPDVDVIAAATVSSIAELRALVVPTGRSAPAAATTTRRSRPRRAR